jgi:SET domain-containing protein
MSKTKSQTRARREPAYRVRRSPVHGKGMFATRMIRKGTCIIEYTGERISHEEADRRHAKKEPGDNHTFLFTIDATTVIDGNVGGNESRFINHSCDPNCEVIIDEGRLLIEAIRTIRPGEEIVYQYMINRAPDDPPDIDQIFACRCGAASCQGTMLEPRKNRRTTNKKSKTGKTSRKSTKEQPKRAAA